MNNIFEYKGYYQDFLDSIEVNLTIPYKLADKISLDIDYKRFVNYFVDAAEHVTGGMFKRVRILQRKYY